MLKLDRIGPRVWVCLTLVTVIAVSGAMYGAPAVARPSPRVAVLKPEWHLASDDIIWAFAGQRYVLMTSLASSGNGSNSNRLLDEQTGQGRYVSRPGCEAALLGGPWLLFDCYPQTPRIALYRISTGQWVTLQPPPGGGRPWAVGADWIQYNTDESPYQFVFQSITTGRLRTLHAWHAGGRTVPNLDSPTLSRKLCPAVRVPDAWDYGGSTEGPGDVSFFGGFALTQGTARPSAAYATKSFLQRCGSRLHRTLAWAGRSAATGNAHAIMSALGSTDQSDPQGIFLPSLRPFKIAVRSFLATTSFPQQYNSAESYELFVTARRIYLMAPYPAPGCGNHPDVPCPPMPAQLWYAPTPKQPPTR
jgi:hypothetical protein